MGGGYLAQAAIFLIDFIFGLFVLAVMLRFVLQIVRADFYNPLSQAIVTVTNPLLRPLRRFIPSIANLDTASIVLMLVLQLIASALVLSLSGFSPHIIGLVLYAVAELVSKVCYLFLIAIFIRIIIGWIAPHTYNPVVGVLDSLTDPLLRPARRLIPPIGGAIDLSPMLAVIGLSLAQILIVAPIRDSAMRLM